MYEVMARRYRPGTFDEVVGQEHVARTLQNAIDAARVGHAYLFCGGHGCGKTTMARIFAKALVCEKGPTSHPCGVCPFCRDVARGVDVDVMEIDGASNNGVDQIRTLRDQAAYVPTRARFKIFIIDEVHMLTEGAFNALLKTLEEPPPHVKFILATTDPHKIPDTILSRCQRFDFRLVPPGRLAEFFKTLAEREGAAVTEEALEAVAAFAGGSVRDGLVLLDQLLSYADGEVTRADVERVRGVAGAEAVAALFGAFTERDAPRALAVVDETAARGVNVGDFLDQLIDFGRDLMALAATEGRAATSAYGPAKAALAELSSRVNLDRALVILDVLSQARVRVRQRALTHPLVALEMAVARLAGLPDIAPLAEWSQKLERLARAGRLPERADGVVAAPPATKATDDDKEPGKSSAPTPVDVPPPAPPPATAKATPWDNAPAASPEPGAEPAPADDGWNLFRAQLAKELPDYAARLEGVRLRETDDGGVRLTGSPHVLEPWDDARRLARLGSALARFLGRETTLRVMEREWTPATTSANGPAAAASIAESIGSVEPGVSAATVPPPRPPAGSAMPTLAAAAATDEVGGAKSGFRLDSSLLDDLRSADKSMAIGSETPEAAAAIGASEAEDAEPEDADPETLAAAERAAREAEAEALRDPAVSMVQDLFGARMVSLTK